MLWQHSVLFRFAQGHDLAGIIAEVPFATGASFGGKEVLLRLEPQEETV